MSAKDFDDDITEEASEPELEGRGVTLEDFVALMPGHQSTFIFTPCRQPWPGANVNARLPRVPLLDQFGQPLLDEKGKIRTISPTTWLISEPVSGANDVVAGPSHADQ